MKYILCSFVFFTFFVGITAASEIKEIRLKDGSVLTGELISYNGAAYTIQTPSLGRITIDGSKVSSLRTKSSSGLNYGQSGEKQRGIKAQAQAIQRQITENPKIMKKILSLQEDPNFKSILSDPAIMNAVSAGNIESLTSNPDFMNLLNNSAVKDISEELKK